MSAIRFSAKCTNFVFVKAMGCALPIPLGIRRSVFAEVRVYSEIQEGLVELVKIEASIVGGHDRLKFPLGLLQMGDHVPAGPAKLFDGGWV